MTEYENSLNILKVLFAKDYQFALATSNDNIPSVRFVDTFYDNGAFYIVSYAKLQKVQEIEKNNKFYKDETGYKVDFENRQAEEFPFTFDIVTVD
ncbi:hypothetical protein F3K33_16450 [Clostridium diolis]|nr:hypothetical protein F3K33_16450 [Clostridium diolis]